MGISPIQLLIVLIIVVLIFGGKRLRTLGSDLGEAIKGFKQASRDNQREEEGKTAQERVSHEQDERVIDGEVKREEQNTPNDR